ncbi:unnamed protein product [Choristocarpus tenellus]
MGIPAPCKSGNDGSDEDDWTPPHMPTRDQHRVTTYPPSISPLSSPLAAEVNSVSSPNPLRSRPSESEVLRAGVDQLSSSSALLEDMNGVLRRTTLNASHSWMDDPLGVSKNVMDGNDGFANFAKQPSASANVHLQPGRQRGSTEEGGTGTSSNLRTSFEGYGGSAGEHRTLASVHSLQMHTYIAPTFCDACSQLLVGLMSQGLQCSVCKMNLHIECRGIVCSEEHRCRPPGKVQISSGIAPEDIPADVRGRTFDRVSNGNKGVKAELEDPLDSNWHKLLINDRCLWVPDSAAAGCMVCSRPFNFIVRRHHCRRCGACVCGSCSHTAISDKILATDRVTGAVTRHTTNETVRCCAPCTHILDRQIARTLQRKGWRRSVSSGGQGRGESYHATGVATGNVSGLAPRTNNGGRPRPGHGQGPGPGGALKAQPESSPVQRNGKEELSGAGVWLNDDGQTATDWLTTVPTVL